jgi:hypothetical protein
MGFPKPDIHPQIPLFPFLGLDNDNGGKFINE